MSEKIDFNGYELSKNWFDFCFENPEKITPSHTALYFFIIEHCNRLGWKEKFGLPTQMAMEAIGVKNWRTYSKSFKDLASFGFINVIESSKNQYSATVIALVKNTKANTKALTKAMQKHVQKQDSSIAVIDKPYNQELLTKEQEILIPALLKIFLEKNTFYPPDEEKDSPALRKISVHIANKLGFKESTIFFNKDEQHTIKLRWGEIVTFIHGENFFRNYSLSQIEKHFQSIIQKKENGTKISNGHAKNGKSTGAHQLLASIKEDFGIG